MSRKHYAAPLPPSDQPTTRTYQQEMLDASLVENIIIAQDTGSGKTHIAVLRMKIECDREPKKVSWFIAPTVALCEQQHEVISKAMGPVGLIHGALEPKQWKDPSIWRTILQNNRVIVSTPQVLLDALSHGYINLGFEISLLVFDEAHHANDNHPMNCIMRDFYFSLPLRQSTRATSHGPVREERPMILGLTASPTFGGRADKAFRTLELNLDSVIRSPRENRNELAAYVHRPVFKYVTYDPPSWETCHLASRNLQALKNVTRTMNIEHDPYVVSLRNKLEKPLPGAERTRVDQKLSKTIRNQSSYTHKGLRDLASAAHAICYDLGPWAADWYLEHAVKQALGSASPYAEITTAWQAKEKAYLIECLKRINITPVSYEPSDIDGGIVAKLRVLIRTLEEEKARSESYNEPYSGLVFVTRRDAVIALAAVLEHHPRTSQAFRVGSLLGTSESSQRVTLLDITRKMAGRSQADTLSDFRSGERNLIVATAVAEEGLDIQACGNVIRWDLPSNMVAWAQSRGRARRKRSSFVLMFDAFDQNKIQQFEAEEKEMVALYNTERQAVRVEQQTGPDLADDEKKEFKVQSTGALLTLQAAVTHLNHFCSVIPHTHHEGHLPLYDIDPPDMPQGWHSLDLDQRNITLYQGPFGCTLTLPKSLPPGLRLFSVERKYPSKRSAYQRVAFKAYMALYDAGLLNDHLLPLCSVLEPELEEDVKEMLKDIEQRSGTASVTGQLNPWLPVQEQETWWSTGVAIDGLPLMTLFTRIQIPVLAKAELPVLYHPRRGQLKVQFSPSKSTSLSPDALEAAQKSTRRLFWSLYGSRMEWADVDFAYLFTNDSDPERAVWDERRKWAVEEEDDVDTSRTHAANAEVFGKAHRYPTDITWLRDGRSFGKLYRFVRWHFEKLTPEEEEEICAMKVYSRIEDVQVTYPLLVVEEPLNRSNFLLPLGVSTARRRPLYLLARYSYFELLSSAECELALLIPSILRHLTVAMTVKSFQRSLLPRAPLRNIPYQLLTTAITAPVASDQTNYQRLESLGDAVLKFVAAMNLFATYPLWHEGYLTKRKDHAVANSRLAKEAIKHSLFRWIIRTRFSPKRFKPEYLSVTQAPGSTETPTDDVGGELVVGGDRTRNQVEELSTKMLADVVESLIGAAYLHGGFDLGIHCVKVFGLGLEWAPLQNYVDKALARVELLGETETPLELVTVERMLGYVFKHKLLLVEALTHASYQFDCRTVSYERMEFLGDALLDMIAVDYLYSVEEYGPGDIHIRKSAVVNTHFLAYMCLRLSVEVDSSMPGPGPNGKIVMKPNTTRIHLYQCLQHSSPTILEEQKLTASRFERNKDEIEEALQSGMIYPWAALTRLQAPKLFSDMIESLIGAVYLDSGGSVDTVRKLLERLGIMVYLDRVVRDEVDVLHPVSRLSIWADSQRTKIAYDTTEERGYVVCTITVEGRDPVNAEVEKRGHASQEEARFAAAEKAITMWGVGKSQGNNS